MNSGRIMLLSCPEREDVIDFWFYSQRHFWPDCLLQVDVLDQSTTECWTRRLSEYLKTVSSEWLVLWVDDNVITYLNETELARCFHYFRGHPDIAVFHFSKAHDGPSRHIVPIKELAPYAAYAKRDSLMAPMHPEPAFWRTEALRQITADVLPKLSAAQDDGWVGFYNWELAGWRVLMEHGWNAVVYAGEHPSETAARVCNAVYQGGGWTHCAVRLASEIGYELNPERGYHQMSDPPIHGWKWASAGPPRGGEENAD